ncbi:MAG: RNA polymerase sigma factor [Candidatus Pristimantibacillus sp.]
MQSKLLLLLDCNFDALTAELQKEIYLEFYNMAYSIVSYMVGEHQATEDIIQESFMKVITGVPSLKLKSNLKGWMKVVIKNMTYNYLRKRKRNQHDIDIESVFMNNIDYSTSLATIEKEVELKVLTEMINSYITELKPEYRALLELRWKHDLSYREIAVQLETTEDSVKTKLFRAREAVKKRVIKEWGEPHGKR